MTDAPHLSPVARVLHWLQDWRTRQAELAELDTLGADGVRSIASDLGLSPADLRELTALGPHAADLMPRLMTALGLDPAVIERAEPMVFRDLQRACACCSDHGRCAHDLADGTIAETYREYCPNAETMSALQAEIIADQRRAARA